MAVVPVHIAQRRVIAAGTLVCQGTDTVLVPVESIKVLFWFAPLPNAEPRIELTADGRQLDVAVVNADLPPNSPLSEKISSFVETVGETPQGEKIVMALYIHSRGQAGTRQMSYTFSA